MLEDPLEEGMDDAVESRTEIKKKWDGDETMQHQGPSVRYHYIP